ncbi:class I SAM-dependent methyltransferase [Camelliibacillus cellulosilyticus]|uniref:Class I SAM-dependent methyltransferase n=1 Tax=Camelliibacillus cellulosilyticus TaxID=2174486 RepID=A0ABV9GM40_9BACL
MDDKRYLNFLAKFGISSAHPGGMPLTKALLETVPFQQTDRVLDIGCGTGETSIYLAKQYGCEVIGCDLHPGMVAHARNHVAREQAPVQIIQGDAEQLPFPADSFDKIISESVTVFTNIDLSLKEYKRVLKPGGVLIDLEMTAERPFSFQEEEEVKAVYGIARVLTKLDWLEALYHVGFRRLNANTGNDFLRAEADLPNASSFELTEGIDAEAFETWLSHIQLMEKYRSSLSYRIYTAVA